MHKDRRVGIPRVIAISPNFKRRPGDFLKYLTPSLIFTRQQSIVPNPSCTTKFNM
ncbi:hypothetical protein HanXRQr2_Chr09g0410711 [Helianthus annuus]|uniref:Uncharacterized protein n=1 Tax=Helianthus annuus TaxID=4232 RepID=A0A251TE52_HELAN|nr:hypothetical protein HanXRQr2_Chr09g0410711 [Helianthus annuus]